CMMLPGRANDKNTGRRNGIERHNLNKGAGIKIAFDEMIRKPGNAEPCHGGGGERSAVVRFEPSLRMNGNRLVTVHKLPGFRSLHECLMVEEIIRRLRGPVFL